MVPLLVRVEPRNVVVGLSPRLMVVPVATVRLPEGSPTLLLITTVELDKLPAVMVWLIYGITIPDILSMPVILPLPALLIRLQPVDLIKGSLIPLPPQAPFQRV